MWASMTIGDAARHYTLAGKLDKGNCSRSLRAKLSAGLEKAHQKNKSKA
jgi:hypothetical protein